MNPEQGPRPPVRKRTRRATRLAPDGQLTIRWFTPKGREALAEFAEDLRCSGGANASEILEELRRPGAMPNALDLRGVDLRGLELANANLAGADLRQARIAGANLMRADLSEANLDQANLRGAKLQGAQLKGANLMRADLRDADLSDAVLDGVSLESAKLKGAEVRRASAIGVDFSVAFAEGVDLSRVQTETYVPAPSRARMREQIGAPPGSEPIPTTQRFRKKPRPPMPEASAIVRRPRIRPPRSAEISGPVPKAPAASSATLDAALAQILLRRPEVDRIVVTINGEEVELFSRDRPALRVAG